MNGHPANWFHPRRRRDAQRVAEYLAFHGHKVYLPGAYEGIQEWARLDRYHVDQALDDLYALGNIDRREAGDGEAVELLDYDLDRAAKTAPPTPPKTTTRFFLRKGDQHGHRN